jgi:HEPN domain-containing protein
MPHDPALIEETRDWLTKAAEDLNAAKYLVAANPPFSSQAAFHAQQAAEKAEKAFLTWNQRTFSKTHDLRVLGSECGTIDPSLMNALMSVAAITGYAVEPRYPGPWIDPSPEDAREAIRLASEVLHEILARLPVEVSPN